MSGIATAIGGSAVLGAIMSDRAAKGQAASADRASEISNAQYKQNREDQAPWREAGVQSLGQLTAGLAPGGQFDKTFNGASFTGDPGYQFRLGEGQQAIERSAAARGGLLSGGTLRELTQYGQGFASNEYGSAYNRFNNDQSGRFNRLTSVAGLGQTATGQTATDGTNNAQIIGNNIMGAGNARAAGSIGVANSIGSGVQSLGNFYQQQQMMNLLQPGGGYTPTFQSGGGYGSVPGGGMMGNNPSAYVAGG